MTAEVLSAIVFIAIGMYFSVIGLRRVRANAPGMWGTMVVLNAAGAGMHVMKLAQLLVR